MSRVGKKPVEIPKNVKVNVKDNIVSVEGPKGKLEYAVSPDLKVSVTDNKITVENPSLSKEKSAIHGLARTLISNLIKGVTDGYSRELEIRGVGFKAQVQGDTLQMTLGFSHVAQYKIPQGITITTPKPMQILITGIDKIKVGEVASEIRSYYKPEPYTGKGVRYAGEYVRHKAGKTVVK